MNKNTKEDKSETILRLAEAISKGFAKKPEESPQKILSPETKIIEKPKEIPKEIAPKEIPQEKTEEPMVPEVKNSELEIYKITLKDLLKQRQQALEYQKKLLKLNEELKIQNLKYEEDQAKDHLLIQQLDKEVENLALEKADLIRKIQEILQMKKIFNNI